MATGSDNNRNNYRGCEFDIRINDRGSSELKSGKAKKAAKKAGNLHSAAKSESRATEKPPVKRGFKLYHLFLIAGILVLIYPLFMHIYNSYSQNRVVADFSQKKLDDQGEAQKLMQQIDAYQKKILNEGKFLTAGSDPFDGKTTGLGEIANGAYGAVDNEDVQATLHIPKLDLDLPVYLGCTERVLRKGIGIMNNSSMPYGGIGTNCVMSGHRGTYNADLFRNIDQLVKGDLVVVENKVAKLGYRVVEKKIVLPYETDAIKLDPTKDKLTLLTCHPYMINSHRLIVTCERDTGYVDEAAKGINTVKSTNRRDQKPSFWEKVRSGIIHPYYLVAGVLVIVFVVYLIIVSIIRKKRAKK